MTLQDILVISTDPELAAVFDEAAPDSARIELVATAGEALARMLAHPANLVVIDDPLPDLDGCEAVGWFSRFGPETKVFFVTSRHSPALELRVRHQGPLYYTGKPLEPAVLRRILARAAGLDRDWHGSRPEKGGHE